MTAEETPGATRRTFVAGSLAAAVTGTTSGCSDQFGSTTSSDTSTSSSDTAFTSSNTTSSSTESATKESDVEPLDYVPRPDPRELDDDMYFLYQSEPATLAELDMATDASDFEWMDESILDHFDHMDISPIEVQTHVTGAPTADDFPKGNITVLSGTFDMNIVRHRLSNSDYWSIGEYEGAELLSGGNGDNAAAIRGEMLLLAQDKVDEPLHVLRDAIDARTSDERERVVDNDEIGLLVDHLDGEYVSGGTYLEGNTRRRSGYAATGTAYRFDADTVELTLAIVFNTEAAIREEVVDSQIEYSNLDGSSPVDRERDGRVVLVTDEQPLEGFEP